MKLDPYQVVMRPVVTEKSHLFNEPKGKRREVVRHKYVFEVDPRASKHQIKDALEVLYDVKVHSVNTMRMPGKTRRVGRNVGKTKEWKKAVVALQGGHTIELY